jgi:hypothetical protein
MNMASSDRSSLVVADEAEALLSDLSCHFDKERHFDKGWINEFMETPGNPVIWIVNYPELMDQSTLRRFSFALYFPPLGLKERRRMWNGILSRHKVAPPAENRIFKELVTMQKVPAAVIDMGVRNAVEIGGEEKKLWGNIAKSVESFVLLQQGGEKSEAKKGLSPTFTPAGVTAAIDADALAGRLKALDRLRGPDGLPPGSGTLLFYGPPGTGKTALARYLASGLGKELIVKKASSILDCWVGNTEKNIAKAFHDAEYEDAVLVIDEADTFLYSRDTALRSWEVSFVNEFLANAEECRCFMIATSNRRESMDAAAMRRFSFKVPFSYAGPKQLEALYLAMLAPIAGSSPETGFLHRLKQETSLAPGDFHAVRSRYRAVPEGGVTHEELFKELLLEIELKLDNGRARIGF